MVTNAKSSGEGLYGLQWWSCSVLEKRCRFNLDEYFKYHMDAVVKEEDGHVWRLTGIYGEPKAEEKEKTWRLMRILNNLYKKPWLCFGDFNEILFGYEKEGGQPRAASCMERFRNTLEDCGLEDLGCEGDMFTWRNNHHKAAGYIKERLDRAVAWA